MDFVKLVINGDEYVGEGSIDYSDTSITLRFESHEGYDFVYDKDVIKRIVVTKASGGSRVFDKKTYADIYIDNNKEYIILR